MKSMKKITSMIALAITLVLSGNSLAQDKDIVELAAGTEDLSTLVTAVKAAGLVETLQSEGPFTVFAPTNAAFEALPDGVLDMLLKPENKDKLKSVLTYHVLAGEVMSKDVKTMKAKTVEGSKAQVTVKGKNVMVDSAKVVMADVNASNGVVHVIDAVILPPSIKKMLDSSKSDY